MRRHPAIVLFLILFVSLALRLFRIDFADGKPVFDEKGYYIAAAHSYLENRDDPNFQHPPLGKELIALGIVSLGDNPYGWRVPSLIFSLFGIVLTFLLARELFGGTFVPLVSAFLVSVDSLYFVYSRLAVLDMFLTVFVLATLLFLWRTHRDEGATNLMLLAVSFGLALATKWTALHLVPVMLLFLFFRFRLSTRLLAAVATTTITVALIYVAAYTPYIFRHSFRGFLELQHSIVAIWRNFGKGRVSTPESYFLDHAHSWILNPMTAYFTEPTVDGKLKAVVAHFNPVVYWGSLLVLVWAFHSGDLRRDRRTLFLALPLFLNFVPWFFIRRIQYLYYFLPSLPLLVALTARALYQVRRVQKDRVTLFLLLAVAVFAYEFPFLVGMPALPHLLNPVASGPMTLRFFEQGTKIGVTTIP